MSDIRKRLVVLITIVSVCLLPILGCASKVVVGRSLSAYNAEYAQADETEPSSATAAPATEAAPPAGQTVQAAEQTAPQEKPAEAAPEKKPSQSTVTSAVKFKLPPTPKPQEKQAPPPAEVAEATPASDSQAPEQSQPQTQQETPKPTVTPQSSMREAMPEQSPAPYQLDLSFGGFGLSQGLFDTPVAVAVDDDENIYVVDQGNFRIQKFDRFGQFQFAWGRQGLGDGEFEVKDVGGAKNLTMTGVFEFNKPVGMLLDTDETRDLVRITVVDSLNHRLQRFLLTRTEGEVFPDEVFVRLPEGGLPVLDSDLKDRYSLERTSVILDPVYIQKAERTFLTPFIWGGLGFAQGQLNTPSYLAKDDSGYLYVTDTGNGRVESYYVSPTNPSTDATFYREFGNSLNDDYGAGRLKQPTAIVYDNTGYGSFLVLDDKPDGGQVIERFDREGEFKGVFAETGGKPGQLRQPISMAISPFDNTVFITDRGHRKVMVYSNKGEFLFSFGGDELADPRGITVLRNNYVYVTDAAKNMVYRYIPK